MKKYLKYIFTLIILSLTITSFFYLYEPSTFVTHTLDGMAINGERYSVKVPENRTKKDSRKIKVKFLRLKSNNPSTKAPIFYLAGGPGDACRDMIESPYLMQKWSHYLKERDVVLIDQRGVGSWKMWWVNFRRLPVDIFSDAEVAKHYVRNIAHRAKKAFDKRNVDLSGYNTIENAKDIDSIRAILGYDKIVPFGFSYGTHLGLCYIKYSEEHVDKAILVGVEGLDQTYKKPLDLDKHLAMIGTYVSQDSTFMHDTIGLVNVYKRVMDRLDEQPLTYRIKTPFLYKTTVNVGRFGLNYILKRDLGDSSDIPNLVRLLYLIDGGQYDQLQPYVEKRYKEFVAVPAMHMAMDLASGGSQDREISIAEEASISMFGNMNNFPYNLVNEIWNIEDLGDDFRSPHSTEVPLLVFSGTMDINTPTYQAEMVKQNNPNATHLIVENSGHEHIVHQREFDSTVIQFLNDEDVSQARLSYPSINF